ncbi:MAG TPA: winged helix-turn-helix domain-containing protein [Pirellulaceae bacterium]|nr:winged helix-turn-helix domain-containing protein [Pirellulaceae bacterium]
MTTKTKTTKATTTARNAKKATKAQSAKPATKNATRAKHDAKESKPDGKKISQIEAAIIVLGKSKDAMNCKAMVEAMQVAGLWSSPGGATPDATLYASILREINAKGKDARFRKTDRGHFTLASRK